MLKYSEFRNKALQFVLKLGINYLNLCGLARRLVMSGGEDRGRSPCRAEQ
jgi:hypothetical protein